MEKSDREKGKEVLKKRERARKGFSETNDRGEDPIEEQQEKREEIAKGGLALGLGMKRSG